MKRALTDKDTILPEAKKRNNQAEPLLQDVPRETTDDKLYHKMLYTLP
jgi:hypothetical protein